MNTDTGQFNKKPSSRDKSLDYVKGWLVVGMAAYHSACMNERAGDSSYLMIQSVLDFISGSWVYLCGIIIATYYANKSIQKWSWVAKRLMIRGLKLISIFLAINILLLTLGWSERNLSFSLDSLYEILIAGGSSASFGVLMGIGYLLVISPLLLIHKKLGIILATITLSSVLLLNHFGIRAESNHWYIACGMGGFLVGRILATDWFRKLIRPRQKDSLLFLAAICIVVLYFILKFEWNYGRQEILAYLAGITSILAMLYLSFQWLGKAGLVMKSLDLLGRYPLVSYIWQMGIIVYLSVTKDRLSIELPYIVDLTVVLVALLLSIHLLNFLIYKYAPVKKIYRWFFG